MKQQSDQGALILGTGLLLMAVLFVAFYLLTVWVDDGDGTCGAVYQRDVWRAREGCSSRMMWRGFAAYALILAALRFVVVAWRRSRDQETADLRRARSKLRSPALLVTVGLTLGLGWLLVYNPIPGRDAARRRAVYGAFPMFPGARKIDEHSYEIRSGDEGTGHYRLSVSYELPRSASPREVFDFLRGNAPSGWGEVTDEACAVSVPIAPPPTASSPARRSAVSPPTPTSLIYGMKVERRDDQLTMLPKRGTEGRALLGRGITFSVLPRGQNNVLYLDSATISCGSG